MLALRGAEVERALLAVGGPVAGGALTAADLQEATPAEAEATATLLGEGLTVYAPRFPSPAGDAARGDGEVVLACDGRGLDRRARLRARARRHRGARPRGDDRPLRHPGAPRRHARRAGHVLPAPAPLAIAVQSGGFAAAVGLAGRPTVDVADMAALARGAALETALAELRDKVSARAAVAVMTDGKTARAALV